MSPHGHTRVKRAELRRQGGETAGREEIVKARDPARGEESGKDKRGSSGEVGGQTLRGSGGGGGEEKAVAEDEK